MYNLTSDSSKSVHDNYVWTNAHAWTLREKITHELQSVNKSIYQRINPQIDLLVKKWVNYVIPNNALKLVKLLHLFAGETSILQEMLEWTHLVSVE